MTEQLNLYGSEPHFTPMELSIFRRGKHSTPQTPGTGPEGETCGTCGNARSLEHHDKRYWKCAVMEELWTRGPGSDVKLKWPACRAWMAKQ